MEFRCNNCGKIFDEESAKTRRYYICDIGSEAIYESDIVCPNCSYGDFDEVSKCDICGVYYSEDEITGCVCNKCIEEKRYDIDFCYKISLGENEGVDINCFLASMFTPDEINEILWNNLKEKQKSFNVLQSEIIKQSLDCTDFIDSDREWFSDKLWEEHNNEIK